MVLELRNLNDEKIREFMLEELENDIKEQNLYFSKRFKESSMNEYITILRRSIEKGDDNVLANEIKQKNLLKSMETKVRKGKGYSAKVPKNAHLTLAEGEFNRFYIRGVCRKAITEKLEIEVYRAKPVRTPRSKSQRLIGTTVNPERLLSDLQKNIGVDLALGIPGGANSGLSVRFKIH